jgi:hypothetical protein
MRDYRRPLTVAVVARALASSPRQVYAACDWPPPPEAKINVTDFDSRNAKTPLGRTLIRLERARRLAGSADRPQSAPVLGHDPPLVAQTGRKQPQLR